MGVADKMWDAITTVIKMNDKVRDPDLPDSVLPPISEPSVDQCAGIGFR